MFEINLSSSTFEKISQKGIKEPLMQLGVEARAYQRFFAFIDPFGYIITPILMGTKKQPEKFRESAYTFLTHQPCGLDWVRSMQ